jgi:hypothetical protein
MTIFFFLVNIIPSFLYQVFMGLGIVALAVLVVLLLDLGLVLSDSEGHHF